MSAPEIELAYLASYQDYRTSIVYGDLNIVDILETIKWVQAKVLTGSFTNQKQASPQGNLYSESVNIKVGDMDKENYQAVKDIIEGRVIVIVKNKQGDYLIAGLFAGLTGGYNGVLNENENTRELVLTAVSNYPTPHIDRQYILNKVNTGDSTSLGFSPGFA